MKILLTTLHAKYSHASLALPCLAACAADVPGVEFVIREWTVKEPRERLLRQIMAEHADLVAFSCYIWNIETILRLASDIKGVAPETRILLGGPEASYGAFELMHAHPAVDFVIKGEGELPFRRLTATIAGCSGNLLGRSLAQIDNLYYRDGDDITSGALSRHYCDLDRIPSPFAAGLVNLDKPLVYYETSRGCPFSCAFCLSSVEGKVRSFGMERIRSDLLFLMEREVETIKLVDRTFNYDAARANEIWKYILEHNRSSRFHFEVAAGLLTDDNMRLLRRVPPGAFHFEIGVQSASEEALEHVGRPPLLAEIYRNVRQLRSETGVELHLDLLAGLPGEGYAGFLTSLQAVADLAPHQIQVEPLKVLKGSAMREIALRQGYHFSSFPPYTILRTPWLSFDEIGRIETIGRLLDLFCNNGRGNAGIQVLLGRMTCAELFDRMANRVGDESLSGLSTQRVYELFARLAEPLLDETARPLFHDALLYDYCRQEMPLMGKLPSFAGARAPHCAWPDRRELSLGPDLPADSRVKAFRCRFLKDYRTTPPGDHPAVITFAYISGSGRGLRILTL